METPQLNTGILLKKYFEEKRIRKAALSRKLNRHSSSIQNFQKNSTIQTAILWEMCHALQHNFFMDIALQLPKDFSTTTDPYTELNNTIAQLQQEIVILKAEKEVLLKVSGR